MSCVFSRRIMSSALASESSSAPVISSGTTTTLTTETCSVSASRMSLRIATGGGGPVRSGNSLSPISKSPRGRSCSFSVRGSWMRYELTASMAGVSWVMKMTTHAPAVTARTSRNVAVARRSAGNAGAIIGTSTNSGELITVDDVSRNEKVPVVAARNSSAGAGRIAPDAATERSTASIAMRTS